jgi:hypothetical protein
MASEDVSYDRELPLVYVTSLSNDARKKLESLGVFSVQQLYGMIVQGESTRGALRDYLGVSDSLMDRIVEECKGVLPKRDLELLEGAVDLGNMPLGALPEKEDGQDEKGGKED